jgi:TetR/AcrR family transcriptional regulator, regulator of biofilm formation and stress response
VPRIPSDVRRQQFIEAAVTVIARDGVDGATTRRIAEEAGAPLATLHYCFQTKENLLWAVFERLADTVRTATEQRLPDGQDLTAIASELVRESMRTAIERPDENRTQIEIWLWAERNDAEFASRMYDKYLIASQEFLRKAKVPLPADELETVTRMIIAVVDGLCMQLITHGDETKIMREVETSMAMLSAYLDARLTRVA